MDNLEVTKSRIYDLLSKNDEEDIFVDKIELDKICNFLTETTTLMKTVFQKASVSFGYEGSIRLQWFILNKDIRLVVKNEKDSYIFYDFGEDYGVVKEITPRILAEYLDKVI